jgi:hypothetical protein
MLDDGPRTQELGVGDVLLVLRCELFELHDAALSIVGVRKR